LTDGEMKLYSYLCMMIGNSKNDCWASQKYLAKKIGKKGQNAISMMTDNLQLKKYITKKTIDKDGVKHCIYNLNY
ncbi:helix-turn-helix domain-containing protein, partial [Clostridium perfringens]|nr:helix-turn-helix domain-containing protein [Clostridium perfringens]